MRRRVFWRVIPLEPVHSARLGGFVHSSDSRASASDADGRRCDSCYTLKNAKTDAATDKRCLIPDPSGNQEPLRLARSMRFGEKNFGGAATPSRRRSLTEKSLPIVRSDKGYATL